MYHKVDFATRLRARRVCTVLQTSAASEGFDGVALAIVGAEVSAARIWALGCLSHGAQWNGAWRQVVVQEM